jgi:signal transduction histidine kinase
MKPDGTPAAAPDAGRLAARRERSLLSLFELSHELSVSLDPFAVGERALFNLMGHFGTSRAALWMLTEEPPRQAVLLRSYGLRPEVARALGMRIALQADSFAVADPQPMKLGARDPSGRTLGPGGSLEHGLAVLVPVVSHSRLVGIAAVGERLDGEPYGPLDLEYVSAAAGMLGVALENTRLYLRMLESNRQLRQVNDQLAQLDRMKSQFLQTVNHELRTPLAVALGYLQLMLDSGGLSDEHQDMTLVAVEQCEKLSAMVLNLLDFSAIDSGELELACKTGDLAAVLRGIAEVRRPGIVEGLRELEVTVPDALVAHFDRFRVEQVVDALLDNAVKFTPLGTRIRLTAESATEEGKSWVRVHVTDNGPGIPPRHLASLFEPFRQGDGSTTRRVGGLGISLALAQRVAESMGGQLAAASRLGEGTRMTLTLRASE